MRRVVVTGVGVVAPNGVGRKDFWSACLNGRSGVGVIRTFDSSRHPVKIAAEVHDFDVTPYLPTEQRKNVKLMSRAMRFAVGAASLSISDSGLDLKKENSERLGVVMGTGLVPIDLPELAPRLMEACDANGELQPDKLGMKGTSALFPLWVLKYLPNMVAAHISLALNAQGPNSTITTACSAGTQAVGEAFRLIGRDDADIVLAGGADSRVDPLLLLAYTALGALSRAERSPCEVSRPFDGKRDGFVLGEGAGVLVLEELEHAKKRDAPIYAEVLGMGSSFDAYSITKPDPKAGGAARAIEWALKEARIDHRDVDYINAHGTGTPLNDASEANAINHWAGERAAAIPVSSTKASIGHLLGAAGAVETAVCLMAMQGRWLPPTRSCREVDSLCRFPVVTTPTGARIRCAVTNSFGFGGANASLVLRKVPCEK